MEQEKQARKRNRSENVIYMVSDPKNGYLPLFIGTMSEVCEYTGKSKHAILSAIGHAKARGNNCRYMRLDDD